MLPNFIVIGARKSGTTSLWNYLRAHPQVFMPDEKEIHFFLAENFAKGVDHYRSLFPKPEGALAVGEASTTYSRYPMYPGVAERMARVVPDARLVYLVRHPTERLRSHYLQEVYRGRETRPIDRAVLEDPQYVDASRYAFQLDQYMGHFGREQVLVVTTDELRAQRGATVRRVVAFVGADPDRVDDERLHEEHYKSQDKLIERPLARAAKRIPHGRLSALAPRWIRSTYRSAAYARFRPPPTTLAPDVVRVLEDRLRADAARLRDYLGPGFDGWGLL
ncbi:MAG: sulfotransferase [Chloroflexi bacterium]|nr:sulfotransferase [Chloroflexota bacterium]